MIKILKGVVGVLFISVTLMLPVRAQVAYHVIYPSGGDDAAIINAALVNSARLPVQLALDMAHPARHFQVSTTLVVPSGGTLVCENTADNNGNGGQAVISAMGGFTGSSVIHSTGSDPKVRGCSVYGSGAPAGVDCFAADGSNYGVWDTIHANYCTGAGLNLTSSSGDMLHPQLLGHSTFYNSAKNAIAIEYSSGGSTSDLDLGGADIGTNCTGGCNGQGDVYIFGSNGKVHDMRIEWSWNEGFTCDGCFLNMAGNLFDRPGGAGIHLRGQAYLNISGGMLEGTGRAQTPQYSGPAILFEQDQWGRVPAMHLEGTAISQWASTSSYFRVLQGYFGPAFSGGLVSVDGNGIQPTAFGIYADQYTRNAMVQFVIAPPAYPQ